MQVIHRTDLPGLITLIFFICFLMPAANADVSGKIPMCTACHGTDGVSQLPNVPTIAGISTFVIEEYMFEYRDEVRPCRGSMCAIAKQLSDDDIAELAEFFSGREFVAAKQDFDAAKGAAGAKIHVRYCVKCHSDGGSDAIDDASILSGQWTPYLEQVFADYATGERGMLEDKMKEKIEALNADSISALVHYYASMQKPNPVSD
jgi:sulfide dehydrogenase cytochrome subunit